MNERIRLLALQAGSTHKQNLGVYQFYTDELEKFAELIVRECDRLNLKQSFELSGVAADAEHKNGPGFDSTCLDTVKRVEQYLYDNTFAQHFGFEK
jgi:hypothetical protein